MTADKSSIDMAEVLDMADRMFETEPGTIKGVVVIGLDEELRVIRLGGNVATAGGIMQALEGAAEGLAREAISDLVDAIKARQEDAEDQEDATAEV